MNARPDLPALRVEVAQRVSDVAAAEWNALTDGAHPFMRHEFLAALEDTGCIGAGTGWDPCLVTLRDAESRDELAAHLDVATRLTAVSQLTRGVAHEIKNPLNAIRLHLEVLRTRLEEDAPELNVIAQEIYTGSVLALQGTTMAGEIWSAQTRLDGQTGQACDNRSISLIRIGETSMACASLQADTPSGFRNSSARNAPGCRGGALLMIIDDFDIIRSVL